MMFLLVQRRTCVLMCGRRLTPINDPTDTPGTGQGAFRVGWGNRPAGKTAAGDHGRRQWTCQTCKADVDDDGVSWPPVSVPQDELVRTNLGRSKSV